MLQGYPEREKEKKKKSEGLTYQSGVALADFSTCVHQAQELILIALHTTNLQFPMSFCSLQTEACFP